MPYDHHNDYPAPVRERAARVRLACFDVDGTLTDGRLLFDTDGRELKAFHVHDGLGMVLLRQAGIEVAFITARTSSIAEQRAAELGITEVHTAVKDKLARVGEIAERLGISMDEVAFMGDDLPDLRVMLQVGLSAAPASAHPWVRERVRWRTSASAGLGAVREFCDLLLAAQGRVEALLDEVTRVEGMRVEGTA
ncbi:KdsC family phosphatase [Lysobacter zhanggongensis]|uniref:3-deoxy-D-manno-octulosonate 8-phosphate phosphatase KdsC n=2 Tax=Lysobacteraceae TaxID=32033 RepID=A0ABU7YMX8_9GAMM|nr:HAD hydrolase family protein [Lysobacter luteus]CAG4970845.1 3-deoxy-D-manno-octulosonate 8-phosphate phosphatase KdsC [Lysobacter luteus]